MNENIHSDFEGLSSLLDALAPWLSKVVIIGGWAHRLFRYHPLAQTIPYEPIFTLDTDVAVPPTLEVGERNLRDRLERAGFKEKFLGEHQPPATHYCLGEEEGSFYAEFLTPLVGSEIDRQGNPRATTRVGGVTSQNLRYVDMMLASPWTVELSQALGLPFKDVKKVQIAHPTRFLAQKLLILTRRDRHSRAKDILYLHDTIEVFGASLDVLNQEWTERLRPTLFKNAVSKIENSAEALFATVTEDVRAAAQVATGRALSPDRIRQVCRAGLKFVFGHA